MDKRTAEVVLNCKEQKIDDWIEAYGLVLTHDILYKEVTK